MRSLSMLCAAASMPHTLYAHVKCSHLRSKEPARFHFVCNPASWGAYKMYSTLHWEMFIHILRSKLIVRINTHVVSIHNLDLVMKTTQTEIVSECFQIVPPILITPKN